MSVEQDLFKTKMNENDIISIIDGNINNLKKNPQLTIDIHIEAVHKNYDKLLKYLIDNNLYEKYDEFTLEEIMETAIQKNNFDLVKLAISKGYNTNYTDLCEEFIKFTFEQEFYGTLRYLVYITNNKKKLQDVLWSATKENVISFIKFMVKNNIDISDLHYTEKCVNALQKNNEILLLYHILKKQKVSHMFVRADILKKYNDLFPNGLYKSNISTDILFTFKN